MLKWFGRRADASPQETAAGAQAAWAQGLQALLVPIDGTPDIGRTGLAHDLLQYVLHGTGESALTELRQIPGIHRQLPLLRRHRVDDPPAPDLYEHFDRVAADVALRFGRLLEAGAPPHGRLFLTLPEDARWPELLMLNAAGFGVDSSNTDRPRPHALSAARLASMLSAAGLAPDVLLVAALGTPIPTERTIWPEVCESRLSMVRHLAGYAGWLERHIDAVQPLLLPKSTAQRRHVVRMLQAATSASLARVASDVCALAVSDDKPVRIGAETLVRRIPQAASEPLHLLASRGKPGERRHARLLLEQAARARPAAPALPVIDGSPAANAVPPTWLDTFWAQVNDSLVQHNRNVQEHPERLSADARRVAFHPLPLFSADDVRALQAHLATDALRAPERRFDTAVTWLYVAPVLQALAVQGITPVALLRVLIFFQLARDPEDKLAYPAVRAFNAMHRHSGRPTLLELATMMDGAGMSGAALLRNLCNTWDDSIAAGWDLEAVRPYLLHHAETLAQALVHGAVEPRNPFLPGLFKAVDALTTLPDAVANALFELALSPATSLRESAQAALAAHPGTAARAVDALANPKGATRALAADWLVRLGHTLAVPALHAALATEKPGPTKNAMQDALRALGGAGIA